LIIKLISNTSTSRTDYNKFIRMSRMSKLYKLIKITRLVRLIKVLNSNSQSHLDSFRKKIRLNKGIEKLSFFFMILMLLCHLVACIWIFTAKNFGSTDDEEGTNWIEAGDFLDLSMG
jgi:hypothetical protein